jgi:hypothetical protein
MTSRMDSATTKTLVDASTFPFAERPFRRDPFSATLQDRPTATAPAFDEEGKTMLRVTRPVSPSTLMAPFASSCPCWPVSPGAQELYDGEKVPLTGHALEHVRAAVLELKP